MFILLTINIIQKQENYTYVPDRDKHTVHTEKFQNQR